MKIQTHIIFCFLLLVSSPGLAQIQINEVCADNQTLYPNISGEYYDWIELHNPLAEAVQLEGFSLSDDSDQPQKYVFPNLEVPAGGFLLLYASEEYAPFGEWHLPFKIAKQGEHLILQNTTGETIDFLLIPPLETDESYGRHQDQIINLAKYSQPSPNQSNSNGIGIPISNPPQIQIPNPNDETPAWIEISCPEQDCTIYYSLDGSDPLSAGFVYTQPIPLDSTRVVKAVSVQAGYLPSPPDIETIFVELDHSLPVLSLCTEPDYLWDWEEGIFQTGPDAEGQYPYWGANYWKDIQIPVYASYYEQGSSSPAFNSFFEAEIHGGRAARTKPMKPLRLTVEKRFGPTSIEYPFFPERENNRFRRLLIRNASGDYNNGHLRDAFLQRYFIQENLNLDVLAYQPLVVYINGDYWGVMNLREKVDEHYLAENYDIDRNNVDLLEEDSIVIEGDFAHFDATYDFVIENDMSDPMYFDWAASLIDLENLADYFIAQTAVNNTNSFHGNIKYWRERIPGAPWRYILFDLDVALGRHGWTKAEVNSFGDKMTEYQDTNRHVNLLKAFLENEIYRIYFINRYADLLNSTFRPSHFLEAFNRAAEDIDPEMPEHFDRWGWPGYDVWKENRLEQIRVFIDERPDYARQYLAAYFQLAGQVNISLEVYPPEAGIIRLNTLMLDESPWEGIYFRDVPVEMEVVPNPGYTFSHWAAKYAWTEPRFGATIQQTFGQDDEVVAWFEPLSDEMDLKVLQNPAKGKLRFEILNEIAQLYSFYLFATDGKEVSSKPNIFLGPGTQVVSLDVSGLSSGCYILRAANAQKTHSEIVFIQ
ncbi:MAG: hypothetical protein GYB31_17525 [Bacteroidetes bacterium]|nr:hypothetical protein [Bacteroidota bacterium]